MKIALNYLLLFLSFSLHGMHGFYLSNATDETIPVKLKYAQDKMHQTEVLKPISTKFISDSSLQEIFVDWHDWQMRVPPRHSWWIKPSTLGKYWIHYQIFEYDHKMIRGKPIVQLAIKFPGVPSLAQLAFGALFKIGDDDRNAQTLLAQNAKISESRAMCRKVYERIKLSKQYTNNRTLTVIQRNPEHSELRVRLFKLDNQEQID